MAQIFHLPPGYYGYVSPRGWDLSIYKTMDATHGHRFIPGFSSATVPLQRRPRLDQRRKSFQINTSADRRIFGIFVDFAGGYTQNEELD